MGDQVIKMTEDGGARWQAPRGVQLGVGAKMSKKTKSTRSAPVAFELENAIRYRRKLWMVPCWRGSHGSVFGRTQRERAAVDRW